jgi:hypothetical protein
MKYVIVYTIEVLGRSIEKTTTPFHNQWLAEHEAEAIHKLYPEAEIHILKVR